MNTLHCAKAIWRLCTFFSFVPTLAPSSSSAYQSDPGLARSRKTFGEGQKVKVKKNGSPGYEDGVIYEKNIDGKAEDCFW